MERKTVEELRYSAARFKKEKNGKSKGWFLDLFWLAYAGKKLYVSPIALYDDLPWQEGMDHCASFKGDLPDVVWLDSLINRRTGAAELVSGAKAIGLKPGWHWAKQVVAAVPDCARVVNLGNGFVFHCSKDGSNYVRCVRLSQ